VRRLNDPEVLRGTFLITFELEVPRTHESKARSGGAQRRQPDRSDLEDELQRSRENLQGTIEELETSREEMQSLNEELQTVNAELEERNRALSQANDDMQNLLNSTEVATIFLDDKLAIKRFTTMAKKVFSLIDSDIGASCRTARTRA